MKNFLAAVLLLTASTTAAHALVDPKMVPLTCNGKEVIYEQQHMTSVEQHVPSVHNFKIKPFTEVNIEVLSAHGSSLTVTTPEGVKIGSIVEVSADTTPKTLRVTGNSGSLGKLLVKVDVPKIIISGQQTPPTAPYTLKINCLSQ